MQTKTCVWFGIIAFILGAATCGAIGYAILRPAFDDIRREYLANRIDAEQYHSKYDTSQGKLDESISIINGSKILNDGAIGTIQQAISALRECRRVLSDLRSTLHRE